MLYIALIPALYENAQALESGVQSLGSAEQRIICHLMDLHMLVCVLSLSDGMNCVCLLLTG